jgi:hypothetical protein
MDFALGDIFTNSSGHLDVRKLIIFYTKPYVNLNGMYAPRMVKINFNLAIKVLAQIEILEFEKNGLTLSFYP